MKLATRFARTMPERQGPAPRLKICHLGKYYEPAVGGIETHVRTLAHGQAALGAEVRVVCVNHRNGSGRSVWTRFGRTPTLEECDGDVQVLRLGRVASLSRIDFCPALPALLRCLQTADILHLHVPNLTMLLALAALRPRTPLIITYHHDVIRACLLGPILDMVENFVVTRGRRILLTTPVYARQSATLQSFPENLTVLPLGIKLEQYQRPSQAALSYAWRLREDHGAPLWLAVCRLVYYKGLLHALDALAHVPGKLLIVGEGPLKAELMRYAARKGVAERVVWCGHLEADQLAGAYRVATALWFPSNLRAEAFGLVQVEAMASGCPVINCAIPGSGVPWVCQHEVSGLTVPIDDPYAFAQAARRLLAEPGLRARLAAGGRDRARREFDHRLMARRSLSIYEQVVAGARAEAA